MATNAPTGRAGTGIAAALLDAARDLFVAQGFSRTSVSDITERAGTSVGSLYYHFGGKKEIYYELWSAYMRTQEERSREAVKLLREAGVSDGGRLFLAGARAYLTSAWEHRGIVRMVADGDAPPGFAGVSRRFAGQWTRQNARLLHTGDPRTDRAIVAIVTGAMGGMSREVAECATTEDAEALIASAIETFAALMTVGASFTADESATG